MSTYHSDYFWCSNSENTICRAVFRCGCASDVYDAGLADVRVYYNITYTNNTRGVALVEFTEEFPIEPVNS